MDTSKLSPWEVKPVFDGDKADAWELFSGDTPIGFFEYPEDAAFIALAKKAFDGDPEALEWWEANRRR